MYDYHNDLRATHAGVLAVVGLAARPEARLVLPGGASPAAPSARSTTAATWSSGGSRSRPSRSPPGRRSGGGAWPWRSSRSCSPASGSLGADRPGDLPVPLLHGAAVRAPRPGLLRGRALARAVAPDLAPGPGARPRRRPRPGRAVARSRARSACSFGSRRSNPGSQACSAAASRISLTAQLAGLARRHRGGGRRCWSGSSSGLDRPYEPRERRREAGAASRRILADRPASVSRPRRRRPRSSRRRRWSRRRASRASSSPSSSWWSLATRSPGSLDGDARRAASWPASCWRRPSCSSSFYPNSSGLPLPGGVFNWYQGLLPTWLYPFQFPVNTDPPVTVSLAEPVAAPARSRPCWSSAGLIVAYSAWVWRIAMRGASRGRRRRRRLDRPERRPPAAYGRLGAGVRRAAARVRRARRPGSRGGSVPWAARRRIDEPVVGLDPGGDPRPS